MAWNPGQKLFGGRYIIEKHLGEGGMGITYLAKNLKGELRVIKTLREEILNRKVKDKLKQDFKQETLRLALCRHPHIVEIKDYFDEGDLPCTVMEYIEGEDLGERIETKGALPEAEALQYIRQIGEALTVVHEKGLLHRDLKPSNIMIRAGKPEAVLIDFGLARQFIPGAVLDHTEHLTPGYAPPEQYLSQAERGEYIDVYALAATLYTLLTGQKPISAFERQYNYNLKQPQYLNSSISDRVNEAIMKGMELDYKSRPQSVREWLDLLAIPNNWECVHNILDISGERAFSPKEDIHASVAGRVIHLLSASTGKLIRTLSGHSDCVRSVAFSRDGQFLASGSFDKTIKLWNVSTGKEIYTLSCHSNPVRCVAFSRDGQFLASGSFDKTIKLWNVSTGKEIYTLSGHSRFVNCVAFSSDGQFLASGSFDNTIKLWNVSTGKEIYTLSCHSNDVYSVAFSRDGQFLASGSDDNTIKLWNVSTGKEIYTLSGHSDDVYSVAFSRDGQFLASGSPGNTIKLWNVATGKEIQTLSHFDKVFSVAFSPDGGWLAARDKGGNIKIWRRC
ncbi:serine/threonine protein kinase [Nodularia sp. LEGE 06071]|uniref:serine/threonine-protein kinase n=1 Tax=Nodularia sp. LEGE 06071 TaxID=2777965 RepID=UPI00187F72DC|nr:serine/threonine-protein kinase [Nodularia sp. LEGE 06071]MBE9198097.1 serine/threonine protein kinase [Nodularia sp. LEGE 06071]